MPEPRKRPPRAPQNSQKEPEQLDFVASATEAGEAVATVSLGAVPSYQSTSNDYMHMKGGFSGGPF